MKFHVGISAKLDVYRGRERVETPRCEAESLNNTFTENRESTRQISTGHLSREIKYLLSGSGTQTISELEL